MKIEVHPDDVDEYQADDRGRIYLGTEYAESAVEVAVVDAETDETESNHK